MGGGRQQEWAGAPEGGSRPENGAEVCLVSWFLVSHCCCLSVCCVFVYCVFVYCVFVCCVFVCCLFVCCLFVCYLFVCYLFVCLSSDRLLSICLCLLSAHWLSVRYRQSRAKWADLGPTLGLSLRLGSSELLPV